MVKGEMRGGTNASSEECGVIMGLSADATDFKPPFLAGFVMVYQCSITITRLFLCPKSEKGM